MSKIEDGGPAYPVPPPTELPSNGVYCEANAGMSLRDRFAIAALTGIMAQSHPGPDDWVHMGWGWGEDTLNHLNKGEKHVAATIADFAYAIADAMIAARKGGSDGE